MPRVQLAQPLLPCLDQLSLPSMRHGVGRSAVTQTVHCIGNPPPVSFVHSLQKACRTLYGLTGSRLQHVLKEVAQGPAATSCCGLTPAWACVQAQVLLPSSPGGSLQHSSSLQRFQLLAPSGPSQGNLQAREQSTGCLSGMQPASYLLQAPRAASALLS